jgi:hypothetical protein
VARDTVPADRRWVPALLTWGRRAPSQRAQLNEGENRLLRALEQPGCPVCHESRHDRGHYFFWFFAESYYQSSTLDALERSLGFCLGHADMLARRGAGGSQLTYVHDIVVRRARALLAEPADRESGRVALAASGTCPACENRVTAEARNVYWLGALLNSPEPTNGRYGRPGMLCCPHLRAAAPRLSDETLVHLIEQHDCAMRAALDGLSADAARPLRAAERENLLAGLLPLLALTVTGESDINPYPSPDEYREEHGRDPVGEFIASLAGPTCPVCREVRRAWLEWTSWLQAAADRDEPQLADLLPTCAEHLWPLVRGAAPPLAVAAARQALVAALGELGTARHALRPAPRAEHERLAARLRRLLEHDRRIDTARAVIARGVRCPVCARLDTARDRALALLPAALGSRRGGDAFERGYGLCVRHLAGALAADPPSATRALLTQAADARLATLEWELGETMRKNAWQFRPEQHGAEQTAWRRALLRFAGSLRESME